MGTPSFWQVFPLLKNKSTPNYPGVRKTVNPAYDCGHRPGFRMLHWRGATSYIAPYTHQVYRSAPLNPFGKLSFHFFFLSLKIATSTPAPIAIIAQSIINQKFGIILSHPSWNRTICYNTFTICISLKCLSKNVYSTSLISVKPIEAYILRATVFSKDTLIYSLSALCFLLK